MPSLERRITELERATVTAAPPSIVLHFIAPGAGVVAIRAMTTGQELERMDGESEAHFLARAKRMNNTVGAQHGES